MISGYPVSGNQHPVVVFQSDAGALEKQDPDERSDFGISSTQHPASSIHYLPPIPQNSFNSCKIAACYYPSS